jgi:hypothetical protein
MLFMMFSTPIVMGLVVGIAAGDAVCALCAGVMP